MGSKTCTYKHKQLSYVVADEIVDIEHKRELMHVASMYFESLDHMLDVIDMDQSTYYSHLNGREDMMNIDHANNLAKTVCLSEPRFRFDNYEDYIQIPEEEAWGEGRIKLDPDFRKFLFGRKMFDPLNEEFIESLTGFSRASFSNYRKKDRWIPKKGYRNLFNYFAQEFNNEPTVTFNIFERKTQEPIYDNLNLAQFTEYCINNEIQTEDKYIMTGNPTNQRLALEKARLAREKFDSTLGDYLEEWEHDAEAFDVRNEIVYSTLNDRNLTPSTPKEEEKLDELVPYGIVRPLKDNSYLTRI